MSASSPTICFAVVLPGPRAWFDVLSTAFTHPWVISYQVGFGPPLVRAHDRLIDALRSARSALDKLEIYLEHCYLDAHHRRRLAGLHRRLLVRRFGPLEAEAVRSASRDVLDLTVQLYPPSSAPDRVRSAMRAAEIERIGEVEEAPEHRTGRFWIHLNDPRNYRLMDVDAVRHHVDNPDDQAVLALTVPATGAALFDGWLQQWTKDMKLPVVRLEGPVSVARAYRDGVNI
ncbi:MAG: hypothetical protein AAFN74_12755 [Myxococcota bacterium]